MEPTCSDPVLLGLYDSACPSLHCTPYENKIGGLPDFFPECVLSSPPSCVCCGNLLALLVQVYCPLESSVYHRLLHVYCCVHPSCHRKKESWLVLRSQLKDDTLAAATATTTQPLAKESGLFPASDWCDNADDWGSSEDKNTVSCTNPDSILGLHQQLNKLSIIEPTERNEGAVHSKQAEEATKSMSISDSGVYTGPYYPPGYLQVIEEPTTYVGTEITHARNLLERYQLNNPEVEHTLLETSPDQTGDKGRKGCKRKVGGKASHSEAEGYERVIPKHGDRTFQKFQKQLAKCPQQLLRYSRGGTSHLITDNAVEQPPDTSQLCCQECGSSCVFELQLMPTLVYVFQQSLSIASRITYKSHDIDRRSHDRGSCSHDSSALLRKESLVEFGTVLIYTCSESCWEDKSLPRTEKIYVQMDTDKADCLL